MAKVHKVKVTPKVTAEKFAICLIEKAICEKRSVSIGTIQNQELREVLKVLYDSKMMRENNLKVKHCKKTGYWIYLSAFR
jgi:hypothetical protein